MPRVTNFEVLCRKEQISIYSN